MGNPTWWERKLENFEKVRNSEGNYTFSKPGLRQLFRRLVEEATNKERERIKEKYGAFGDGCGCCERTDLKDALEAE